MLHQAPLKKFLKNVWPVSERFDRLFDAVCPFFLRQILAGIHPATTPREIRKATDFENKLPLPLTELLQFPPILNPKPRDDSMVRNWSRIDHPRPREKRPKPPPATILWKGDSERRTIQRTGKLDLKPENPSLRHSLRASWARNAMTTAHTAIAFRGDRFLTRSKPQQHLLAGWTGIPRSCRPRLRARQSQVHHKSGSTIQ